MSAHIASVTFRLPDEDATLALGARAAASLPDTAEPLIVFLQGELGTGKTCFVRGVLRALGESGPVRSPTYGLQSTYESGGKVVQHLDLYRLQDPAELHALALRDLLPGSRLWLIEWPERVHRGLPEPDLHLRWSVEGSGRRVEAKALTVKGRQWLAAFSAGQPS